MKVMKDMSVIASHVSQRHSGGMAAWRRQIAAIQAADPSSYYDGNMIETFHMCMFVLVTPTSPK
jgi:hypothetical protein